MTEADPTVTAAAMPLFNRDLAYRMRLQFLVEQFYYAEAAALDQRRYEDWLALFTDDVHYWMPVRRTRTSNELDRELPALPRSAGDQQCVRNHIGRWQRETKLRKSSRPCMPLCVGAPLASS